MARLDLIKMLTFFLRFMTNFFSAPLQLILLLSLVLPIHGSKSIYADPKHALTTPPMAIGRHRPAAASPTTSDAGIPVRSPDVTPPGQWSGIGKVSGVGPDPIRFSIQCDKRQINLDEEVSLTITAQLLNITPNQLFFVAGSNAYTLKMVLPPGFEQTGGDFVDYVAGTLSYASQPQVTYRIRGRFRSVTAGTSFRLLRSHGQANDQSLFAEKSTVALQSVSSQTSVLRTSATAPSDPATTTLTVMTERTGSGSARAGAAATDYRGYLDFASCDIASGWVVNRSDLRKSQEVDIYINGTKVATVTADRVRQDVANALGVNDFNQYGYVWVIPDAYKSNAPLTLSIRPAGTSADLSYSPFKTAVCPGTGAMPTPLAPALAPAPAPSPPTTPSLAGSALMMLTPTYNCSTGAITFNTAGGDGSRIQYRANGITGWTTNPNQFLDEGSRVNDDTPPFTIYVEQSGRTITYNWTRQAVCGGITPPTTPTTPSPPTTTPPPTTPTASALTMLMPTYDCNSGAITFITTGGDGNRIQYRADGITGWTTSPNQFLDAGSRVNADTPPFTIYAEQSGRTITYIWSRQAVCGGATPSTAPAPAPMTTPAPSPGTAVACASGINTVNYKWDGGNNSISIGTTGSIGGLQIKLSGPTNIDWTSAFRLDNTTWFWANQGMSTGTYTVSVRPQGDTGAGCSFGFSVPGTGQQLYPVGGSPAPTPAPAPGCIPPAAPTVSTPNGTQVCNNSTVTLVAAGCSGTVTWSGGQNGPSIGVNAADTYSATCSSNGCTSTSSNQITVTACPVTSSAQYSRVLYVGNSITLHGGSQFFIVNADAKRGMAATSPDKDYVRLLTGKLRSLNSSVDARTFASWNLGGQLDEATGPYWEGNSTKNGIDLSRFDPVAAWKPDLVYIRLGENVTDWEITNQSQYQGRLKDLIDKLISQSPGAKVVLSTSVWNNPNYDAAIRAVGAERNYPIADFSSMWPNRMVNGFYALNPSIYGDAGTDNHPDDDGMAHIADKLWSATPR